MASDDDIDDALMAEVMAQLPAARARARYHRKTRPYAKTARYDRRTRTVRIGLLNGVEVSLPIAIFPALADATEAERADIEVLPGGGGLNWERLDVQYSVPAIIREALGPWVLMQAAGSAGGSVRSKAKAAAARENGKKGGRPRKANAAAASAR
jgi:hypothetical protein